MRAGRTLRTCIAAVLLLAGAFSLPVQAQIRGLPHPVEPSLEWVVSALVDAGVQMPPEAVLQAFGRYLDEFQVEYLQVDEAFSRFRQQSQLEEGAAVGVRDMRRVNEIEAAAIAAEVSLVDRLFDRLRASVAEDQVSRLDAARQLLDIDIDWRRIATRATCPADLSFWVRTGRGDGRADSSNLVSDADGVSDEEFAAQRSEIAAVRTSNAAARARAFKELAASARVSRLKHAETAERFGVVGMSLSLAQQTVFARRSPEAARLTAKERLEEAEAAEKNMREVASAWFFACDRSDPAWVSAVRAQFTAFKQVESMLTPRQRLTLLEGGWLLSMNPSAAQELHVTVLNTPHAPRLWGPRQITCALLRTAGLSEDAKAKIRSIGRTWIQSDTALLLKSVEAAVASGVLESVEEARTSIAKAALGDLAQASGQQSLAPGEARHEQPRSWERITLNGETLTAALSAADEAEFNIVRPTRYVPPAPVPADRRKRLRASLVPVGYDEDFADAVARAAGVSDFQRPVLDALVSDASERWSTTVQPLLGALRARRSFGTARSSEEAQEMAAERTRLQTASEQAFTAAAACDTELFAAIRAALGDAVDSAALSVCAASRRSAEGALARIDGSMYGDPVDLPRVAIEASLSTAGRRIAFDAMAPSLEDWTVASAQLREARRKQWLSYQTGDIASAAGSYASPELLRELVDADAQERAAEAAWNALLVRMDDEILAALAPEDAEQWKRACRRAQWPDAYADTRRLRATVESAIGNAPEQAALRERAAAMLDAAELAAQAAGDGAVKVLQTWTPETGVERWSFLGVEWHQRTGALIAIALLRMQIAQESIRLIAPSEVAARIPRGVPLHRLMGAAPTSAVSE